MNEPVVSSKVLITIPRSLKGGVTSFYQSLQPYFHDNIDFHLVGQEAGGYRRDALVRLLRDYVKFIRVVRVRAVKLVVLNPSLVKKSFFRDVVFLVLCKILSRKVIVFWHGWDIQFAEALNHRSLLKWFRDAFVRVDGTIVLASEFAMEIHKWSSGRNEGANIFLQNTVVADSLIAGITPAQIIEHQRDEGPLRILFLSRVVAEKGIYEVIDAFDILKDRFPTVELVIAGDGSELERIRRMIVVKGLNGVRVLGHVEGEQKREAFQGSHMYVLPSYTEGMPGSVLEAMGCGLPVVTTMVGGVKDFFLDGKMGYSLEHVGAEHIAERFGKLVNNLELRIEMGLFNHKYALEHFTASKAALRLENVFAQVLESP